MARQLRDRSAGLFHVYTHSVWAAELFRNDRDRVVFLRELVRAIEKAGWTCVGVVGCFNGSREIAVAGLRAFVAES
jgi:hypothetical protein